MSNYIEYNDTVAFHPGYYIKEIVDESGVTQKDFAKRLGTTPKKLSLLIRGEQSLSIDIAMKLSRMLGTSVNCWINLQNSYDALIAEFKLQEELMEEKKGATRATEVEDTIKSRMQLSEQKMMQSLKKWFETIKVKDMERYMLQAKLLENSRYDNKLVVLKRYNK